MRGEVTSAWRFFPWAIAAAIGVVVAVNGAMIWSALATFPGKAGRDGFDLSNRYNAVLARVEAQADLGWTVRASVDETRRPILQLADPGGLPLSGAVIVVTVQRPVGEAAVSTAVFQEISGGQYRAADALAGAGQWDLLLEVSVGGHSLTTTRRVLAR